MDPNTWKKIKDAYVSASEMNAGARAKFLDEHPTEIRDRVAKLLNANDLAGEFIENPFLVDQVKMDS